MEKTIEVVKFEKSWACAMLVAIRDELKKSGKITAKRKYDEAGTWLDAIEATLDNVGAVEAMAEEMAKMKREGEEISRAYGDRVLAQILRDFS